MDIASYANSLVPWTEPALAASSGAEAVETAAYPSAATSGTMQLLEGATGWPAAFTSPPVPAAQAAHRGFDIAYRSLSGEALSVYSDGTPSPKYRTRSSTGWSTEQAVFATAPGPAAVDWILLASNPLSNEVALVYSDTTPYLYATVWNGTSWVGSSTTVLDSTGLANPDWASFTAAYEDSTGNLLVVWSHPSTCSGPSDPLYFSTKLLGSTTFSTVQTTASVVGAPGPMVAASEHGTARIAIALDEYCIAACGGNTTCADFSAAMWGGVGTGFLAINDLDNNIGIDFSVRPGSMPVGVGWLGTSGTAVAVYAHPGGTLGYTTWTSAAGWAAPAGATMTPVLAPQAGFQLIRVPSSTGASGDLAIFIADTNGNIWSKRFDGTTWSDMNGGVPVATGVWFDSGKPFGAVAR